MFAKSLTEYIFNLFNFFSVLFPIPQKSVRVGILHTFVSTSSYDQFARIVGVFLASLSKASFARSGLELLMPTVEYTPVFFHISCWIFAQIMSNFSFLVLVESFMK